MNGTFLANILLLENIKVNGEILARKYIHVLLKKMYLKFRQKFYLNQNLIYNTNKLSFKYEIFPHCFGGIIIFKPLYKVILIARLLQIFRGVCV